MDTWWVHPRQMTLSGDRPPTEAHIEVVKLVDVEALCGDILNNTCLLLGCENYSQIGPTIKALERRVKWLEEGQQLIAVGRADGSIGYGVALGWSEKCDDWLSREPKE